MKLAIFLDSHYLVVKADKAQPILEALSQGQLYSKKGWEDVTKAEFEPEAEAKPKVFFVDESQLTPQQEVFTVMSEKLKAADDRWYTAYQEKAKVEKELKETKEKLDAFASLAAGASE